MKRAIVTLTIGGSFDERWERDCRENWQRYADRHGFGIIKIDRPLDDSPRAAARSPAWQKCLILEHPEVAACEQVVWMDSDILIHPEAPDVTAGVPADRVGAVDEFAYPTRAGHAALVDKLYASWRRRGVAFVENRDAAEYHARAGLPARFDSVVQTGVMVLRPAAHAALLRRVHDGFDDPGPAMNYEMRPLSYTLLDEDRVHWLDPRFNLLWGLHAAQHCPSALEDDDPARLRLVSLRALEACHFLHFAGVTHLMRALPWREAGRARPRPAAARPAPATRADTPVVVLVYNRPDEAARLRDALAQARPQTLVVVADGPRAPADAAGCARARAVFDELPWSPSLTRLYSDENLGIKRRVETGLDAVLARWERAIILEDDCIPEPSFFEYCGELLDRYAGDPTVLTISGTNFGYDAVVPDGDRFHQTSYSACRYPQIWGWATWRRAWRRYEPAMESFDAGWLEGFLGDRRRAEYWTHILEQNRRTGEHWDLTWVWSSWRAGGLALIPSVNLISNIGVGPLATHTRVEHPEYFRLPTRPMPMPLRHPARLERDLGLEEFLEASLFSGRLSQLFRRLWRARRATR